MTKNQKNDLLKIIFSAALMIVCFLLNKTFSITGLIYIVPYAIIACEVLIKAAKNIAHGQIFDENFLMAVASLGAIAIGDYPEAVAVMLFYEIGELFEKIAVGKSRASIAELMELRPDTATVERDGAEIECDPYEVYTGDIIVVRPGEKIPLDGTVISGSANIDTKMLTGEPIPKSASEGDLVISGCVVIDGVLRIRAEKEFDESTASKILELVENSSLNKSKSEDFITKFARWYTPAVVISAVFIALVPIVFRSQQLSEWINRALIFLVVSCPCALVVSVPLTYFGGIGGASKRGILIKGSNYLESLAKVDTAVFDKTGTLTEGNFDIVWIDAVKCTESELIDIAASAERYSNHPIAKAITKRASAVSDDSSDHREITGEGMTANTKYGAVHAGNMRLMRSLGIEINTENTAETAVYIAVNGEYYGAIYLADTPKKNAKEALISLKNAGITRTVMLTGDNETVAQSVGKQLGIDDVKSRLLPEDKVRSLEGIIADARGKVMYAGDGINDAPVIMRADVGIAMGALGSDAALEAADIVLMHDDISALSDAIKLSRKTHRIVTENVVFALGVKFAVLLLSATGLSANMWYAVFSDVGVLIIAVLNAIRTLKA